NPNGRKYLFGLNNVTNKEGFFTVQARLSPENDVAETIAIMLTYANTDVADAIRKARTNPDAIPKNLITKTVKQPQEEQQQEEEGEEEEGEEEEGEEDTDSEGDEALAEARQKDYKSEKEARYAYDMLSKKRKFVVNYMDKAFGIPLLRMQLI
uniref:putative zinc-binding metallopeptidase n=1 Tax=Mesomycoplasma ovipneumoniae TaxID=29562 RepID=UPI00311929DC